MPEVDPFAVLAATLAAFVLSSTYYVVFGERLAEVSDAAARASSRRRGSWPSRSSEV